MVTQAQRSYVIPEFSDPVKTCKAWWPQYTLYQQQREILYSLRDNYETIVPAGNGLGKDFIAGMSILWFFCSRRPSRIVTTSVDSPQLEDVLWGNIRKFAGECSVQLPIKIRGDMKMFQLMKGVAEVPETECVGRVAQKGEGMLGKHAARTIYGQPTTLLVVDEASGVADEGYDKASTWAHRKLVIGNPYDCNNFFYRGVMEGDRPTTRPGSGFEKLGRKVIHIRAEHSPNVQWGLRRKEMGLEPDYKDVIPGLLSYADYVERRATWPIAKQTVSLDGEFYEGAEVKMYPLEWLVKAEEAYRELNLSRRTARAIGIDTAEGRDSTCFAAMDEHGLIDLKSIKTPNTAQIKLETLSFMRKHGLDPESERDCSKVMFDRGGGGVQHAHYLIDSGYKGFRTVAFGSTPTEEADTKGLGRRFPDEMVAEKEMRETYVNKRAEMADRLSMRLNPSITETKFSYNPDYVELRNQLKVIPLDYDKEGRLRLLPKSKPTRDSKALTLIDLIGHSPDEMDAVMLANYSMEVPARYAVAR